MRAHNADLLRASMEDPYETEIRVGRAPYMRAKIIEALIDAVSTLKPSAIRHAWNCCHLYPFYGSPNYSKEREEALLRQIPKAEREFLLERNKEAEATKVAEEEETVGVPEAAASEGSSAEDEGRTAVKGNSAGSGSTKSGKGHRKGSKKRSRDSVGAAGGERTAKRRRVSACKGSENESNGANAAAPVAATEKKGRRRRKGPEYYSGVLTRPQGVEWIKHHEEHPEKTPTSRTKVTVSTPQGPATVYDNDIEAVREVANAKDYYTALQEDVDKVIQPPLLF